MLVIEVIAYGICGVLFSVLNAEIFGMVYEDEMKHSKLTGFCIGIIITVFIMVFRTEIVAFLGSRV